MIGLTFDTGALIALERRKQRMRQIVERALAKDQLITVPADVVVNGGADARTFEKPFSNRWMSSRSA